MIGQDAKTAIQNLAEKRKEPSDLAAAAIPAPIQAQTGLGRPATAGTGTAGIASPLTEPDYTTRTFHAAQTLLSTDGIWAWQIEYVATIDLTDDNGQPVQMILDAP